MCNKYSNLARQKKKPNNKKQNKKRLNSPNMMTFFTGPLPVQCGGGRRPGSLADATQDCSTSEDFSPRTVLTKNICRCDHHILQHFPNNNALSNSLRNNLFLDSLNSYPGWLLVTLTRGAWWCRYRGHCRSGPWHLSPRSRVCAQEWHWKDIHSHIHSHTPMHTPKKVQKQQQQNAQLTKHDAFVSWSSSCAVSWWPIFRKLGTWSTTDALSARTLLTENICESVQEILQLSPAEKKRKRKKEEKTLNSPNMMPFFTGPPPVQCGGGRRPGSLADATQDFFTSEDFSPRTVLTKNICRCVHHILQHFPTTMPFLTVSAITYSWIAWTATQADSWWLWHVEPDDVVIADIAGQAQDIFLHGPESAHKNGIGKTFTHTSIPIHPCTLLKKCKNNNSKMLNSPNMMLLFPGPLPVPCAGGRFFRKLGTWSTTDALSARTLLTEKICESV